VRDEAKRSMLSRGKSVGVKETCIRRTWKRMWRREAEMSSWLPARRLLQHPAAYELCNTLRSGFGNEQSGNVSAALKMLQLILSLPLCEPEGRSQRLPSRSSSLSALSGSEQHHSDTQLQKTLGPSGRRVTWGPIAGGIPNFWSTPSGVSC
jgi:hypothetical protein